MMLKRIIIAGLILLTALIGLNAAGDFEKSVPTKEGKLLDINLKSGGVLEINGWDKPIIQVNAVFKNGDVKDWDIKIKKSDSGVALISDYIGKRRKNYGSGNYSINVPRKYDLKIKSMGGGISISQVNGDISGKTMGGNLNLSHLKGVVNLKTMGGQIDLTDSDIDGKVKTMGGRVLLENVVGDVSGSSMGGNVIYKNVKSRSGKNTGKVVIISTMGGDINVSEAAHGADLNTMGGDINIKSAGNFIKAKTMGGNIKVSQINGKINALSKAGNVSVTMTGDPASGDREVKLVSMSGDITLTVPAQLAMDIQLKLTYTEGHEKKYKITSDFQVKQEEDTQWDKSQGSPRKSITAVGKTGDGKHKVVIQTINGHIWLKKAE